MKTKDIVQLGVAVVIFAIAGWLIVSQLSGSKSKATGAGGNGVTVVKVTQISGDFDQTALKQLTDGSQNRDWYTPPDLQNGLGNSSPFKPIQ